MTEKTKESKLYTVEEWIKLTGAMGYYITQQHVRYEAKGWKAVFETAIVLLGVMMFLAILLGFSLFGSYYFSECAAPSTVEEITK